MYLVDPLDPSPGAPVNELTKLQNLKALYLVYAQTARFAGALDVEAEWLADAADMQTQIDELVREQRDREAAEEGRIAREQRIADIASGRYRRPMAFG